MRRERRGVSEKDMMKKMRDCKERGEMEVVEKEDSEERERMREKR